MLSFEPCTLLDVSETHQESEKVTKYLLEGNDISDWRPDNPSTVIFGKGCREPARKVQDSDTDEVSAILLSYLLYSSSV